MDLNLGSKYKIKKNWTGVFVEIALKIEFKEALKRK